MTLTDSDRAAILAIIPEDVISDCDAEIYLAGLRAGIERSAKVCDPSTWTGSVEPRKMQAAILALTDAGR